MDQCANGSIQSKIANRKSQNAHPAFTLIEMLIVVAILAVLMTIVFRLGSLGGADSRRTTTIVRLQRIENCLSGYYAAFGSYPPVKVHGWRDIDHDVDRNGDQTDSNAGGKANQSESGSSLVWNRVNAACRCQPFGCEYPPSTRESTSGDELSEQEIIENWAEEVKTRVGNASEFPLYTDWSFAEVFRGGTVTGPNASIRDPKVWDKPDWKVAKYFKFGVMSFLLPRYLFMMSGDGKFVGTDGNPCAQWGDNNDLPSDPFTGKSYDDQYNGWEDVRSFAQTGKSEDNINRQDLARVANIPSQAVCARWMANLEGICSTLKTMKFFGINVSGSTGISPGWEGSDGKIHPPDPCTHTLKGTTYRNASVTIGDGWGTEFYYYSPAPYQTYTVWSAGPNYKTFPPWMSLDELNQTDRRVAQEWKGDDIMRMSH